MRFDVQKKYIIICQNKLSGFCGSVDPSPYKYGYYISQEELINSYFKLSSIKLQTTTFNIITSNKLMIVLQNENDVNDIRIIPDKVINV